MAEQLQSAWINTCCNCSPAQAKKSVVQGNVGAVIFTVRQRAGTITAMLAGQMTTGDLDAGLGVPVAELLLVTVLTRYSSDGVGCQLGRPGEPPQAPASKTPPLTTLPHSRPAWHFPPRRAPRDAPRMTASGRPT